MKLPNSLLATPPAVWLVKRVISPVQRRLLILTGGRVSLTGRAPVLLLTMTGRSTGKSRTVPLFYVTDGTRIVVCNVRPPSERPNPWPLNLRNDPAARIQLGRQRSRVMAREATTQELASYWPRLVRVWPAYAAFFEETGERSVFVLEPLEETTPLRADKEDRR